MRTSTSQFLTMLEWMEKNGDLNKSGEGIYGRLNQYQKWTELVEILNMDTSGEAKSLEKWKKVWSDLKNNTKRKAARIQKSSLATGRPLTKLTLSDLELRLLNLIGSQTASGLIEVEEAVSETPTSVPTMDSTPSSDTKPNLDMIFIENSPSTHDSMEYSVLPEVEVEVEGCSNAASPTAERDNTMSPLSSRRRRHFRKRFASRRTSRVDQATRYFLARDKHWRNLFSELATEHLRLQKRKLEQEAQWQVFFSKCLDCIESFLK